MKFYRDNTVDVVYKVQVDIVISVLVHDNHWCYRIFTITPLPLWNIFTRAV